MEQSMTWDDIAKQLRLVQEKLLQYKNKLTEFKELSSTLLVSNQNISTKLAKYTDTYLNTRKITLKQSWDVLKAWDGSRWDKYIEGHAVEFSVSAVGLGNHMNINSIVQNLKYEDNLIKLNAISPALFYFQKNQDSQGIKLLIDQVGFRVPMQISLAGKNYSSVLSFGISINYIRGGRRILSLAKDCRLLQLPASLLRYKKEIQNKITDRCNNFFKQQNTNVFDNFYFYEDNYNVRTLNIDSHLSFYAQKWNYAYRNRTILSSETSKPLNLANSRITIRDDIFIAMLNSIAPTRSGGYISVFWFQDYVRTVPDPYVAGSVLHRYLFEVRINNRPGTPHEYYFRFGSKIEGSKSRVYLQMMTITNGNYNVVAEKTIYELSDVSRVEVASNPLELIISY
jgi:hypothetical protein